MSSGQEPSRGHLLLVPVVSLLWGLNWPAVKTALGELGPWTLRTTAILLAALVLAAVGLGRGQTLRLPKGQFWRVASSGLLAIAAPSILIAYAQISAPTGRVAVVACMMPVFTVLLARIFLGELLDRRRMAALVLGISGLTALAWPLVSMGQLSLGIVLALLSALCWAAGTVVMKRFPANAAPLTLAVWQLAIAAGVLLVGMLVFEGMPTLRPLGTWTLVAFGYHALLGQALVMVLWFEVMARTPAGIAALGTLAVPAIGVASATLLLGERPTIADYVGLILIMAAAATNLLPRRA